VEITHANNIITCMSKGGNMTRELIDEMISNPPVPRFLYSDDDVRLWQWGWESALKTLKVKLEEKI